MKLDPRQDFVVGVECWDRLWFGAVDEDDVDGERSGGGELGGCRGAAAVLGDEHVDLFGSHQGDFGFFAEWAACEDQVMGRQGRDRRWRVDRADDVMVSRGLGEGGQLQSSDGQEDVSGPFAECLYRRCDAGHVGPAVAVLAAPGWAGETCQGDSQILAGGNRVLRHLGGERMGGVDDGGGLVFEQIGFEAGDASEAADAKRDGRWYRVLGAAGEGQDRIEVVPVGDRPGEGGCFGGAAENQELHRSAPGRFGR
ncbi:MAG: hypothetical protein QOF70_484 [Acetobacteraceae bacterium]|nr:hypothetical protein [Acetobacteraceae bacterium]